MLKYTAEEYLRFFKDYNPTCNKIDSDKKSSHKWKFFTLPTQWVDWNDDFISGIDYMIDFIKKGNWKPRETGISRIIDELESEDILYNNIDKKYNYKNAEPNIIAFMKHLVSKDCDN